MGKAEELIVNQCVIQRMPLPSVIEDCPELIPGLEVFYEAFIELSSCRQSGFGASPIPWDAMNTYADVNKFEGEDKDEFFYFVRALDNHYLKENSESK